MTANLTPTDVQKATQGQWSGGEPPCVLRGVYTDTRKPRTGALFVALRGPNFDAHQFLSLAASQGASAIMADKAFLEEHPESTSLSVPILAVNDTLHALGELARFYRTAHPVLTVAITGSVGKTTVKELTASILSRVHRVHSSRGNFNNLIGLPLEILEMPKETEVLVVECGADRPGEIGRLTEICKPNIGIVTHVVPCHLERFETLQGIALEKGKLLAGLEGEKAFSVVNSQSAEIESLVGDCQYPVHYYGPAKKSEMWIENVEYNEQGQARFTISSQEDRIDVNLQIAGTHQPENALAAALTARLMGIDNKTIREGLENYEGTWGRMQVVNLPDGSLLVEDVYNSNPASMQAALDYVARQSRRPRIGIFGEMWDLGEESDHWHHVVGRQITDLHLETLIAVGPLAKGFIEGAQMNHQSPAQMIYFDTTKEALEWLQSNVSSGGLIYVKGSRGMKMEFITEGLKNG